MTQCLWCGASFPLELTLVNLLSWRQLEPFPRCPSCSQELVYLSDCITCPGCCRIQDQASLCQDCRRWQEKYPSRKLKHRSLFAYQGLVRDWLHAFKYQGDYRLRSFFRPEVQAVLAEEYKDYQLIPIPLSRSSLAKRGFNQVTAILDDAGLDYVDLLIHEGRGPKQAEKDRKARMTTGQVFSINEEKLNQLEGKPLLLVDDVYTTGRTLMHACDCLESLPSLTVASFSLAR